MSITDELRSLAEGDALRAGMSLRTAHDKVLAIADRIDEEHESAVMSVMNDALYHANDESMAELGWIRLPKDADGEYIHFGDVLDQFGTPMTVWAMSDPDPDQGDCMLELITDGVSDGTWVRARKMRHHHEPTVEDVLQELVDDWDCAPDGEDKAAVLKEYAKRLTLAESEDG